MCYSSNKKLIYSDYSYLRVEAGIKIKGKGKATIRKIRRQVRDAGVMAHIIGELVNRMKERVQGE